MRKKASFTPPFSSRRRASSLVWILVILVSFSLCVFALLRLQLALFLSSSSELSRRSRNPNSDFQGPPKVAFLFLARRNLPLDFLWGSFFEKADVANFSIYIHSEPGFVFDDSTTRSVFFFNRQLPNSLKVEWGEATMIQAERLLLGAALEDPANQRFILLSDSLVDEVMLSELRAGLKIFNTGNLNPVNGEAVLLPTILLMVDNVDLITNNCVPLYNFSYIYNYLMASSRSFVDSFLDKKEGRYNPKMSPVIPRNKWRKGSQWISLVRSHAEVVVDDEAIFPIFKKFCKRRPLLDASIGKQNIKLQKQHNCIPDEHYIQTLFAISDLEGELERRTVTYTLWVQSTTKMEIKGWHPITFSSANTGPQQIKRIKDINNVYYETEYRTEWCSSSSTLVPCFLFARKFSQGAAMRLLSQSHY